MGKLSNVNVLDLDVCQESDIVDVAPSRRNVATVVIDKYTKFVNTRPTTSNLIQGLVLFALGDVFAQFMTAVSTLSYKRVVGAGLFGCIYSGLMISSWIRWLDHAFPCEDGMNLVVLLKVFLTMLVFGIAGNAANVYTRQRVGAVAHATALAHTTKIMPSVFMNDLKVFPPTDALNFAFVPRRFRPAVCGLVSLGWNTYMSIVANGGH